jgi:hypothetical protein
VVTDALSGRKHTTWLSPFAHQVFLLAPALPGDLIQPVLAVGARDRGRDFAKRLGDGHIGTQRLGQRGRGLAGAQQRTAE